MLPTKTNMQGSYRDKNCRICKEEIEETQKHVLQECTEIGKKTEQMVQYEKIFRDSEVQEMKKQAEIIMKISELLIDEI